MNCQSRYDFTSQPMNTSSATSHADREKLRIEPWSSAKRMTNTIRSPMPATMCRAKNHQWGLRSSTTVSPSLINRRG